MSGVEQCEVGWVEMRWGWARTDGRGGVRWVGESWDATE